MKLVFQNRAKLNLNGKKKQIQEILQTDFMLPFSPISNASSGISALETNLQNAQMRMNHFPENYQINSNLNSHVYSPRKNNISIPSDPSSLSSSIDNQQQPRGYANIKSQKQKEVINHLEIQIKSFISFVNAECGQNFDDLDSVGRFVVEYFKPVGQLKKLQEKLTFEKMENESLHIQLDDSKKEIKKHQKKEKELMLALKQLREYTKTQESEVAKQCSEINRLKLKVSKNQTFPVEFPVKNINVENNFPLNQIESLINQQANEIANLSEQRNTMIKNYQILESLTKIPYEVPKPVKIEKIEPVSLNLQDNGAQTETIPQPKQQNTNQKQNIQNKHNEEILSAVYNCLQSVVASSLPTSMNSNSNEISSASSSDLKYLLLTQITKINRYIDDHSICIQKPDLQFLNIINDEDLKETPLFDAFTAVVNILNIILSLEKEPKTVLVEDQELKQRHEDVKSELIVLQNQLCSLLKCKQPNIISKLTTTLDNTRKLRNEYKLIQNQVRSLTHDVQSFEDFIKNLKQKHKRDEKRFTHLAKKLLDDLTVSIERQMNNYNDLIKKLNYKIDSTKVAVFKLKEQMKQEKLNTEKIIESKNAMLQNKTSELERIYHLREIETKEKDEIISLQQKKVDSLNEKLSQQKHNNQNFQDELDTLNNERDTVFSKLMAKNKKLSGEIEKQKKEKFEEIENLRKIMQEKLNDIEKRNQFLISENSKSKASEQTMKMRIEEINRQLQLEKNHFDAKVSLMTAKAQHTVDNIRSEFIGILSEIASKLGIEYDTNSTQLTTAVTTVLEKLDEKMKNEPFLQDALSARSYYGIPPNQSLLDIIQKCNNDIAAQKKELDSYEEEKDNEFGKMKKELLQLQNASQRANEWRFWSISLLKQIKDIVDPNYPEKLARKEIEEILLFSLREKSTIQKLDCLRREKSIIKNYYHFLEPSTRWKWNVKSARPIIIAVICAKRIIRQSGTLPVSQVYRAKVK
ncbi:hypothetical protein TRFO_18904 [Tritrichomonas foetus]|uniref:Uncharacterized protein n=1 Tax=Tritrichomonas foetus TaxID=1144522 RepID=A0A1J4KKA0_9EUKA|nr:hypothetical protein TRFO_18904 [Tritrichomonas foetus]|eukprot:OHT11554.1 hypothetical protein TRFO_18904 [Tritrichomonas foetus]